MNVAQVSWSFIELVDASDLIKEELGRERERDYNVSHCRFWSDSHRRNYQYQNIFLLPPTSDPLYAHGRAAIETKEGEKYRPKRLTFLLQQNAFRTLFC